MVYPGAVSRTWAAAHAVDTGGETWRGGSGGGAQGGGQRGEGTGVGEGGGNTGMADTGERWGKERGGDRGGDGGDRPAHVACLDAGMGVRTDAQLTIAVVRCSLQTLQALVDDGAEIDCMAARTYRRLRGNKAGGDRGGRRRLQLGDGSAGWTEGLTELLELTGRDASGVEWTYSGRFNIIKGLKYDVILGKPFGTTLDVTVSMRHNTFTVGRDRRVRVEVVPRLSVASEEGPVYLLKLWQAESPEQDEAPRVCTVGEGVPPGEKEEDRLKSEYRAALVADNPHVFAIEYPKTLPQHRPGFDHQIVLNPGGELRLRRSRPRRLSPAERAALEEEIQREVSAGRMVVSDAPYAAAVLFAPKKDGSLRLCVDYRAVNSETVKNYFSIPNVDEVIDDLAGSTVFTTMDLWGAYNQLRMHPDSEDLTTFTCTLGNFKYKVCPMGLTNLPATFSTFMYTIFKDLLGRGVQLYMDDLIVHGRSLQENAERCKRVCDVLHTNALVCKLKKCVFFASDVDFLGFTVGKGGLRPQAEKVASLRDLHVVDTTKGYRSFLGMTGFYSRFIPNYAAIAAPLTDALGKAGPAAGNRAEREAAVESLKERLTRAPLLRLPQVGRPFSLLVDTSMVAVGAALEQEFEDGPHPVAYASHKLPRRKTQVLAAHELEFYGLHWAMRHWRHYLEGSRITIYSDHKSLTNIQVQRDLSRQQTRMVQYLDSHFDWRVRYRKGRLHVFADGLSRLVRDDVEAEDEGSSFPGVNTVAVLDGDDSDLRGSVKDLYKYDKLLRRVIKDLKENPAKQPRFLLEDGVLYVRKGRRLCLPRAKRKSTGALRAGLMRRYHDSAVGGHCGSEALYAQLRRGYFWTGMDEEVRRWVATCETCARNKAMTSTRSHLLQPLEEVENPMEHLTMDFVSFGTSKEGNNKVLVVVDRYSKFVTAMVGRDSDTSGRWIQRFVAQHAGIHGFPRSIVSDRDPLFTAEEWRSWAERMGLHLSMATTAHPQSDGQSERTIRTVTELLRGVLEGESERWEEFLGMVVLGYNIRVHSATGTAPSVLALRRQVMVPGWQEGALYSEEEHTRIRNRLEDRLVASTARMLNVANRSRVDKAALVKVGEQVFIDTRNMRFANMMDKWRPRFVGPFKVSKVTASGTVTVVLPRSMSRMHNTFNIDLVRKYQESPAAFGQRGRQAPPPVLLDGQEEWEVEAVRGVREKGRTTELLIHWKGYADSEDSWEPEAYCRHASDILASSELYQDWLRKKKEEKRARKAERERRRGRRSSRGEQRTRTRRQRGENGGRVG